MSTAKFKVGDNVRVIDGNAIGQADAGWLGIISKVDRDGVYDCEVMFSKCTEWTHFGDDHCESKYRYYNSSDLEHLKLPELVEEKPKHRFKVGDTVVALKHNGYGITTDGWKGVVVRQYEYPYGGEKMIGVVGVGSDDDGVEYAVRPSCFELYKSVQPWKIVIESSGDTTTAKYIEGKTVVKTATVTRYHTDEYSVEKAVEAVCTKLFSEEQTVEEPKYKVGDLVECISEVYSTYGKRGYLYKLDADGTWIVDFKVEYEDTHTAGRLPGKTGLWLVPDLDFKKVK